MIAGDADNNQIINSQDFNIWKQQSGQSAPYQSGDLNGDGQVDQLDLPFWSGNRSKLGQLK
jgi:hypothetical protein